MIRIPLNRYPADHVQNQLCVALCEFHGMPYERSMVQGTPFAGQISLKNTSCAWQLYLSDTNMTDMELCVSFSDTTTEAFVRLICSEWS